MNQLYIHSVIKVREWDKTKSVEYNRIQHNNQDSARSINKSTWQGKHVLSSWFLMTAKRSMYKIDFEGV
jgi:hypothetical protein